jgi:hypothetical protein
MHLRSGPSLAATQLATREATSCVLCMAFVLLQINARLYNSHQTIIADQLRLIDGGPKSRRRGQKKRTALDLEDPHGCT